MKAVVLLSALLSLPALAAEPTLYGRYEYLQLPELGQTLKAKMDTGAYTASYSSVEFNGFPPLKTHYL